MKLNKRNRIIITLIITLLVWGHILWDHFHGGIPTHYLLHDDSLPGIPNWLGGILLPFFSWWLLYRIHLRVDAPEPKDRFQTVLYRFLLAMGVSILIAILFTKEIDISDYIMLTIILLAFVFPLYKSEYLLGWVLGGAVTFGAILPMGFGSVFAAVFFVLYKVIRAVVGLFKPKVTS